jgi:hypothetical protein
MRVQIEEKNGSAKTAKENSGSTERTIVPKSP